MLTLVRDADAIGTAEDHELQLSVHQQRRFLGMPDDEPTELTFFYQGRISIAHATTADTHARLLKEAQIRRDFTGAFQLVNGPINPQVFARYPLNTIERAHNKRATDKDMLTRRAVFFDVDSNRLPGISATDAEKNETRDIARQVYEYLAALVGPNALARGDSGNGFFVLAAIKPEPATPESATRIAHLLQLLDRKFSNERVKVDRTVANAARLMPAAGTWKRKGQDTPERPHRRTSFLCPGRVERVSLECLA